LQNWALCLAIFVCSVLINSAPAHARAAKIWVFKTHLTGALNQRLGVAQRLSPDIEILEMPAKDSGVAAAQFVSEKLGARISDQDEWPDLILHTEDWRHELDFLIDLAKVAPKKIGLVYLENPKARQDELDLVVNPSHQPMMTGQNVIRPTGVPSHLTLANLEKAREIWGPRFSWMPQPMIMVLLGGDSLHNVYRPEFAGDLGKRLREVLRASGGSVLVTTTRRTPKDQVLSALLNELRGFPTQVYDWHRDQDIENPYLGGLAMASHVVASGDSMSMLSDVVLVGKPLYIHAPLNSVLPEHSRLIEDLYVQGRARPFTGRELKTWFYLTNDVAAEVAAEIRNRFPCEKWLTGEMP